MRARNWLCGEHELPLDRPLIMGILNVTADSFSDGGDFLGVEKAVEQAKRLLGQGADILDIGAQSTRPGAEEVGPEEELRRIMPVLEAMNGMNAVISVDTYQPKVMKEVLRHDVSIINDVYGFRKEGAVEAVAGSNCGLCVMHMQGTPKTMQNRPSYEDVLAEVKEFLLARCGVLERAGIEKSRICIDPGFGFGKTVSQNFELLARAGEFVELGYPVLYGMSRKSSLGAVTNKPAAKDRLIGTVVSHTVAIERGVQIVRVHDVEPMREAIQVIEATKNYKDLK